MLYVFPDYYSEFQCIAGACRHSCCIGWEIDIDPDTAEFYKTVPGPFGQQLAEHIDWSQPPHFRLGPDERCPFLNEQGLCRMILTLGEEHLCGICADHPRFRNELPGRVETGLGLCCEEAARLILTRPDPAVLVSSGQDEGVEDEIIALRDQVLCALQNRARSIPERVEDMLALCGGALPRRSMAQWAALLLSLERLDETWTQVLTFLRDCGDSADLAGFDAHMAQRQSEYEQLLVYLVYRHLANAFNGDELASRSAFAALGYTLLRAIGAAVWSHTGRFSAEDQVELARLFSSEIEYSQDNMDILLDALLPAALPEA